MLGTHMNFNPFLAIKSAVPGGLYYGIARFMSIFCGSQVGPRSSRVASKVANIKLNQEREIQMNI